LKIAVISDVHGNYFALESALARIKKLGCDQIWCLGDNFGYYPDGANCFRKVYEICGLVLMGNHEAMLIGRIQHSKATENIYRLDHSKLTLDNQMFNIISKLPIKYTYKIENSFKTYLSHGSPLDNLQGYVYPWDNLEDLYSKFLDQNPEVNSFIMGNTHRPLIYEKNDTTLFNVGSIGLPRDMGALGSFGTIEVKSTEVIYKIERFELPVDLIIKNYSDKVHPFVIDTLLR
jgi:predicted phosphodiesterase